MPVTICNNKYSTRLFNFMKYGLINLGEYSIKLKLLVGNENINITEHSNKNIDLELVTCDSSNAASKVYDYYANLEEFNAKWFMRLDDDSITDISHLMSCLKDFDFNKHIYLTTELRNELYREESAILIEYGLTKWLERGSILHEVEAAILSQTAMKEIVNNPKSKSILTKRATMKGVTDQCLAIAARVCSILPYPATFLNKNAFWSGLKIFRGNLAHIHDISEDINPKIYKLVTKIIDSKFNKIETYNHSVLFERFKNKKVLFFRREDKDIPISMFVLNENGIIKNSESENEIIWDASDEYIEFIGNKGTPTTKFTQTAENEYLGEFIENKSVIHGLLIIN